MRFILALSPSKDFGLFLISTAQALFSPFSGEYLLSSNSLPHITLYQFECDSKEDARMIWSELKREVPKKFTPTITGISFIKKQDFYQAELSVKREPLLIKMHLKAKKLIEEKGFQKLTEDKDLYRPHITLAHIQMPTELPKWPDSILEDKAPFTLTLGLGNDLGQYLHILVE